MMAFDYKPLIERLRQLGQTELADLIVLHAPDWFSRKVHGDVPRWLATFETLPEITATRLNVDCDRVTIHGDCTDLEQLETALKSLGPWRKGPFELAGLHVDSEWRSDFKWQRVAPQLSDLSGRRVLDVGCGNGYHAWRILSDGPELVIGIDPSPLFNIQFQAIQHYAQHPDIQLLPLTLEAMPERTEWFDTVLSMGVLYHRRSPIDHLLELKGQLRRGGELCLETLVIDGVPGEVLVPADRYARMRNVWFLPTTDELAHWLQRCGFTDVRTVDVCVTELTEQRTTEWMPSESLRECLDPEDPSKTIEGYPAPKRAVVLATRP